MAIKKKMAGKPAMKKSPIRKAKNGDTVAKSDTVRTEYNKDKELKEVKVRPGFLDTVKSTADLLYKEDHANSNKPGRSTLGKAWRKVANGVVKAAFTPHLPIVATFAGAGEALKSAIANGKDRRAERREEKAKAAADAAAKSTTDSTAKKRMGGKVSKVAPKMMKKAAPKMMMKKTSKKK